MWATAVRAAVALAAALMFAPAAQAGGPLPAKPTFYWQLQSTVRFTPWELRDVDGFDAQPAAGKINVAYFSAGTAENWRGDYGRFPAAATGRSVDGWAGERWLDIRRADVRQVMADRVATFAAKGFDTVEPDNVDGYQNRSGFPLAAQHQLDYNRFLADVAHSHGLRVLLKNDVDQLAALEPWFDGALNEECQRYQECGGYSVFVSEGKPVLQVEYTRKTAAKCQKAAAAGRMLAFANLSLDGRKWLPCW